MYLLIYESQLNSVTGLFSFVWRLQILGRRRLMIPKLGSILKF